MDKTIVMAIRVKQLDKKQLLWIKQFYGDTSKTILMAIWIKQFYGDMDKTIVMAIKQLLWR